VNEPEREAYEAAISYSSEERAFVERLHEALTAAGLHVWFDAAERVPDAPYSRTLAPELADAECVIVVIDPSYRDTDWTRRELEVVLAYGPVRPILPVLRADPEYLPGELTPAQAIDMREDGRAFDEGVELLVATIRGEPRAPIRRRHHLARGGDPAARWRVPPEHRAPLRAYLEWVVENSEERDGDERLLTSSSPGRSGRPRQPFHGYVPLGLQRVQDRVPGDSAIPGILWRDLHTESSLGDRLDEPSENGRKRRLTILGDPGAGKTMLLRRWAYSRADACAASLDTLEPTDDWTVPVFVSLADLDLTDRARRRELPHNLAARAYGKAGSTPIEEVAAALAWAVEAGSAVLLLDGLDEVRDMGASAHMRIRTWARQCPDVPIVVASRHLGYRRPDESFETLELLPLDHEFQSALLERFVSPDRATEVLAQCLAHPAMQEMAENPFLLTQMARLARLDPGPLPTRLPALYQRVIAQTADAEMTRSLASPRPIMDYLAAEAMHGRGEVELRRLTVKLTGRPGSRFGPARQPADVGRWADIFCHLASLSEEARPERFIRRLRADHPELAERALLGLKRLSPEALVSELRRADPRRALSLRALREVIHRFQGDRDALAHALVGLARDVPTRESLYLTAAALVAIGADRQHMGSLRTFAPEGDNLGVASPAWVSIPAGTFWVGRPEGKGARAEQPHGSVAISEPFEMLATPVTQALHAVVTGLTPSTCEGDLRLPVESVNWFDAQQFCSRLTVLLGTRARLPTEAEWEHACRAGTDPDQDYWSGSGLRALDPVGWHMFNSGEHPLPVALKRANHWGLYDLHGNVKEWTSDQASGDFCPDPHPIEGPVEPMLRVMRGGSWDDAPDWALTVFRSGRVPSLRRADTGFRVVLPGRDAGPQTFISWPAL
jgi:formylglycine-generating enzyme required for sulfatase activity